MKITEALAMAARANGLTDLDIAVIAQVSQSQASRWLRQEGNPRSPELLKLMNGVPGFAKLLGFGRVAA